MANETSIEWTDVSWNPVHGCSIVSTECRNCYAQELSLRYRQTLKPWTPANAAENVILKPHKLQEPLSNAKAWRGLGDAARRAGKTDGKLVFVNSMSDLFHEQVPDDYIQAVFGVMQVAKRHDFQVLTKRPDRMRDWCLRYQPEPLPNVWLGTSIGLRHFVRRADQLRETPAAVRFISAEPLLGPLLPDADHYIDQEHVEYPTHDFPVYAWRPWADGHAGPGLSLEQIDWLIVGGESGPHARPIEPAWVSELRDYCQDECWQGEREGTTAFFFKQWGGRTPKAGGRELDERTWDEFPASIERKAAVA